MIITPISAYLNSIMDLAGKLKAIGVSLTDQEITDVLIFNLDNEYSSIAASLIASKDELKITEVKSALLEEEQRKGGAPGGLEIGTSLYSNGIKNDGKGPPGRKGPNRDRREGFVDNQACYRCGRTGHISRYCRATKTIDGKEINEDTGKETSSLAISLNDLAY